MAAGHDPMGGEGGLPLSAPRSGLGLGSLLVVIALGIGTVPAVVLATDASPEPGTPSVDASPVAETIHGWPGARGGPAGLYSLSLPPIGSGWMHKVPAGWRATAPNSVELTFHAADGADAPRGMWSPALLRSWWEDHRFDDHAQVVAEVHTEMWLLDVEGTRIAVLLDSFPDTDPALVVEARAVIESIVVEPTESGHRLVFRLLEGWDSG